MMKSSVLCGKEMEMDDVSHHLVTNFMCVFPSWEPFRPYARLPFSSTARLPPHPQQSVYSLQSLVEVFYVLSDTRDLTQPATAHLHPSLLHCCWGS
ncbi:hypothetical protein L6452_27900 [Arctium lappa]|uniref:Uncharacterized protein n=1 Tax=Arctium lappa TaxID=4217 RepID=A0ACB8ZXU6_ARCLA|nr:hypothetical protein L6452_27900 [Arctium lappa]